jgi:hypothetical protein
VAATAIQSSRNEAQVAAGTSLFRLSEIIPLGALIIPVVILGMWVLPQRSPASELLSAVLKPRLRPVKSFTVGNFLRVFDGIFYR